MNALKLFKFGWKYTHSLKKILSCNNFLRENKIPLCFCHNFSEYSRDFGDLGYHVCTTNLNILKNKKLKQLFSKGLNHIPLEHLNPHLAMAALSNCLANIANKLQLESTTIERLTSALQVIFLKRLDTIPRAWLKIETSWLSHELELDISLIKRQVFYCGDR